MSAESTETFLSYWENFQVSFVPLKSVSKCWQGNTGLCSDVLLFRRLYIPNVCMQDSARMRVYSNLTFFSNTSLNADFSEYRDVGTKRRQNKELSHADRHRNRTCWKLQYGLIIRIRYRPTPTLLSLPCFFSFLFSSFSVVFSFSFSLSLQGIRAAFPPPVLLPLISFASFL